MLPYIKVYVDFIDIVRALDNGARGRLFMAIMQYANDEEVTELTGGEKIAFLTMKSQIDRDRNVYVEVSEKRKLAGQNGAKKRWEQKEKMANAILPMANDSKNSKCYQDKDKDKDKDKEKDKENIKEKDITKVISKKKVVSFCPPTLEEVKKYCIERGNDIDPKRFFDYYSASNWVDGKGDPVKNWKQKLITWEGRGSTNGTVKSASTDNAGRDWGIEYVNS